MNNHTQKLIAFDLDGTVVQFGGEVSKRNCEAFAQVRAEGHILAVVTGRPLTMVPEDIRTLPFVRYIASGTGARIWDKETGEQLADNTISAESAAAVCRVAHRHGCGMVLSFENRHLLDLRALAGMIRMPAPPPHMGKMPWGKRMAMMMKFFGGLRPVLYPERLVSQSNEAIVKLEPIAKSAGAQAALLQELLLIPDIAPVIAGPHSIEVTHSGATKGQTLRFLAERHGIARENVVGFGDSGNDVSMREAAGTLVAVGNACDELKAIADYIAPPVEADGVAHAIYKLGIAQKP